MSYFIKISDWSGDDREDVIPRFAKVFRMSEGEAGEVMDQIDLGHPWVLDRAISEEQGEVADTYLTDLGFKVELSATAFEDDDESPAESYSLSDIAEVGDYAKPYKRKPPLVKFIALALLLVLIGFGLMQTSFIKDLLNGSGQAPEVKQVAPQPQPQPKSEPQTEAQPKAEPHPVITKPLPKVKPLPGKLISGSPENEDMERFGGCDPGADNMNFMLRKKDVYQTQTDFCKKKMIAHPTGEWKCEYSESKHCPNKKSYSCERAYRCIPETPEFDRAKFRQEIIDLENIENDAKASLRDVTTFYGVTVDSKQRGRYSGGIQGCVAIGGMKDRLWKADLNQTQSEFSCKGNTIANPTEGWICELRPNSCSEEQRYYSCNRPYQCIPETPEYNRAKFKKELDKSSD